VEGGGLRGAAPRDEGVGVELLEVRAGGAAGERGDEVAVGELRRAAHRARVVWWRRMVGDSEPRGHRATGAWLAWGLEGGFLVAWAACQASLGQFIGQFRPSAVVGSLHGRIFWSCLNSKFKIPKNL